MSVEWTGRLARGFAVAILLAACTAGDDAANRAAEGRPAQTTTATDEGVTTQTSSAPTKVVASSGPPGAHAPTSRGPTATSPTVAPAERIEYQPGVYLQLVGVDACERGPRPAMITLSEPLARDFAARGFLGVAVDARVPSYRPQFDAELVTAVGAAVRDMAIAVQWLRAHADERCVQPTAIAAAGISFGAIAALALAYSEEEAPRTQITIDEYGNTVVPEPASPSSVPAQLAGFSNDLNGVVSFAGFALAEDIDTGEPPAILFHGRNDPVVPFPLAEKTCVAASAVGVTCELVPSEVGHSAATDFEAALDQAAAFLAREMLVPAGITLDE